MKIGIYDPYLDDIGGGEKYMLTAAACLSQNHEVTIFWDNPEDVKAVCKRFDINLEKCAVVKNIFSPSTSAWQRLQATNAYDALIILSDGSIPLTLSKYLFLHIQQPLSISASNSILTNFKRTRIAKIFYNSSFTSEKNAAIFPGIPSTIIHPPVKHIQVQQAKENIILHVGRYRPMGDGSDDFKKQSTMLHMFSELVDHGLKGWKFVIAAGILEKDQKAFDALKQSVKKYPVEFVENVSNNELAHIYAKAKIYWHASGYGEDLEKHPELAEHFGISTVEAMSAGIVPVVFNAGGQREIVTDSKNGYLWDTLDEFMNKTTELIKNDHLCNSMSKEALRRAEDYTLTKFCQEIKSLFN